MSGKFSLSAYESIVYSGLYSFFDTETQTNLLGLYNRIKSYNEILSYLNQYFDLFTLYDNSAARRQLYIHNVKRYERALTFFLKEIDNFLNATQVLVEKEKPQYQFSLRGLFRVWRRHRKA
jgi:hypothetical protein